MEITEEIEMNKDEMKELKFSQILGLEIGYKKIAIELLINAIQDDAAYNVKAHYETELEFERAIRMPTRVKAKADADSTKICGRCNKELPATKESFASSKKGLYGLRSICKDCDKEYRDANKEKKNEYNRIYRLKNK